MIEVIIVPEGSWVRWSKKDDQVLIDYFTGHCAPHYPVPAITYTFSVSEMGRWALVRDWNLKVYRWWYKRDDGTFATNKGM